MKVIICLIGLAILLALAGCEEHREHEHQGGAYQGPENPGYGHGEYRGYPDYGGYPNYGGNPPGR